MIRRPPRSTLFPYTRSSDLHRELGRLLWEKCGMGRNPAGLKEALNRILALHEEFWNNVNVTGENRSEEHTSELQSPCNNVFRLFLETNRKRDAQAKLIPSST